MRIGPGQPKSNLQEAMTIGKSSSVTLTSEPVVTKNYQQIIALVTMIVMLVLPLFYLPRHMDIAALEQIRYLNQLELLKREAASLAKKPQELQEASVE